MNTNVTIFCVFQFQKCDNVGTKNNEGSLESIVPIQKEENKERKDQ